MRVKPHILLFALACLAGDPCTAALDEVEFKIREAYDWPLRWDNVGSRPIWRAGVPPVYDEASGMHRLELHPGTETIVHLPGSAALRLYSTDRALQPGDCEVLLSDGSGLAVQYPLAPSEDGHSLVAIPNSFEPLLARIRRPASARGPVTLAVFVSRREAPGDLAPYRGVVNLPGASVFLRRGNRLEEQRYWPVEAHRPVSVDLTGPGRYAATQRLRYGPSEGTLVQDYRLKVVVDDQPPQWLEYASAPETSTPVYADERAQAVSREETAFLEIPAGRHRVSFEADRDLYLRLLEQEQPDYLFPGLNEPRHSATRVREELGLTGRPVLAYWQFRGGSAERLSTAELAAERAAHDNAYRGGGLAAAQHLDRFAHRHPAYPEIARAAEVLRTFRSFYRDLLPFDKTGAGQYHAFFLPPRLLDLNEQHPSTTVAEQHLDEWLVRLPDGLFTYLAPGRIQEYRLPPSEASGWLQMAVDRLGVDGRRSLWLKLDDQAPLRVELAPIPADLDADDLAPRPVHAALSLLAQRYGLSTPPTQSGAFAVRQPPGPLIDAGHFELSLPRSVRRVRVWQDGGALVAVALRYRAERSFAMGEVAYRSALSRVDAPLNWFFQVLREPDRPTPDLHRQDLRNDWLPTLRLIGAEAALYRAAVNPPSEVPVERASASDDGQAAGEAERRGDLVSALENRSKVAGRRGRAGEAARLAQADLLRRLGETYLAERLWRQIALYGAVPEHRATAAGRLEAWYLAQDDRLSLRQLRAALLFRDPVPERLARLVESLTDTVQYSSALKLAALLPEGLVDRAGLLRASLREGWIEMAERLSAALPEAQRNLWTGWLAQRNGANERALELWRKAGPEGDAWGRALREGQSLAEPVAHTDRHRLALWQQWWRRHPGSRQWLDGSHWVWDYRGSLSYYSLERDVYGIAYRSDAEFPVRLGVVGPARLRLRVRPLHPAGARTPIDDWLHIYDDDQLTVFPLTNNQPVEGLIAAEDQSIRPGQEIAVTYDLGPGWHDLELLAEHFPLALQVDEWRPELPLSVLPPLRPSTADGLQPERGETRFLGWGTLLRSEGGRQRTTVTALAERPAGEVAGHRGEPDGWRIRFGAAQTEDPQALALAQGDWEALLKLPEARPEEAATRINAYAFIVEHDRGHAQAALARAERLWRRYGGLDAVNATWQRLVRHSFWEPVTDFGRSPGIRELSLVGWQPVEPYLRIRRALMAPVGESELILADPRPLVLVLNQAAATNLHLALRPLDVPFLPKQAVTIAYRLDEQPVRTLRLESDADWRDLKIAVPAGEHTLRLAMQEMPANLFLRVRVTVQGQSLVPPLEPMYHVVGPDEPLELYAQGPAWLRMDRRTGQGVSSDYRELEPGWQSLRVESLSGGEELVRVQTRRVDRALRPIANRETARALKTVPPTPLAEADAPAPDKLRLQDAYALGLQEDGTWSLGLDGVRRNNLQEDISRPRPEQFLEYHATHRYRTERDAFLATRVLARLREHGGPTFGVRHQNHFKFGDLLFADLEGNVFVQALDPSPEASAFLRGGVGSAVTLSPKTDLLPGYSLFGRYLSVDPGDVRRGGRYDPRQVDQDIFTSYKFEHRAGSRLSLDLRHRPWLDTLWHTGGSVTSNEDMDLFSPDHLGMEVGWSQLFGPVVADLNYRERFFQKDQDRARSIDRAQINASLSWSWWARNQNRIELAVSFTHDFSRDTDLGMFSVTWHGGEGRGLRDFNPGELSFPDLLKRNVPDERNNQIDPLQGF